MEAHTPPLAADLTAGKNSNETESPSNTKTFASFFQKSFSPLQIPDLPPIPISTYRGEPTLMIPQKMVEVLSKPYQFALVGKFSHGRPTMDRARLIFNKLGLKGNFSLGHLDHKHMLINLENEGDFTRLWLRESWMIDGFPMRMFRWTPNFRPEVESSIVPVWIQLPNLPLFMFNKHCIFPIARSIGSPLALDLPAQATRPSLA